jgi:hypothetical protein
MALQRDTAERRQQKLNSASEGDRAIIEFATDACLPGVLRNRPWIARTHGEPGVAKHLQTPGLYDVMKAHGGPKLARLSDQALANIVKAWGFKTKPLKDGKAWEAPSLPDLRKAILAKFPAVEFDDRKEWQNNEGQGAAAAAKAPKPTVVTAADTGEPNESDADLDARIKASLAADRAGAGGGGCVPEGVAEANPTDTGSDQPAAPAEANTPFLELLQSAAAQSATDLALVRSKT